MLRSIADKYSELKVVTYQQSRAIADQLNVLLPNTMQNDVLAMLCMVVISLLFIPNPICTFWIFIAMVTIDLGEFSNWVWSIKVYFLNNINSFGRDRISLAVERQTGPNFNDHDNSLNWLLNWI